MVKLKSGSTQPNEKAGINIDIPEQLLLDWPKELAELIKKNLTAACQSGQIAGYPLTDLQLSLD